MMNFNADTSLKPMVVIGGGRMGAALAWACHQAGFPIAGVIVRRPERREYLATIFPPEWLHPKMNPDVIASASWIFLAVPDDAIPQVVDQLADLPITWQDKIVGHLSGVNDTTVLTPLHHQGAVPLSFHPILAVGQEDPREVTFAGAYVDIEGPPGGLQAGRVLAERLQMIPIEVTARQKVAIHLAAVVYSNFLVGVAGQVQQLFERLGLPGNLAVQPFEPPILSTLANLQHADPAAALTGPIKRGDVHTVERHLGLLQEAGTAELAEVYQLLSRILVTLAATRGLPEEVQQALNALLSSNQ